jgi:hypothetical protein
LGKDPIAHPSILHGGFWQEEEPIEDFLVATAAPTEAPLAIRRAIAHS